MYFPISIPRGNQYHNQVLVILSFCLLYVIVKYVYMCTYPHIQFVSYKIRIPFEDLLSYLSLQYC